MRCAGLLVLLPALAWSTPASAQTAREIADRVLEENHLGFDSGEARVELRITDRDGTTRVQRVRSEADEKESLRRARITFLEPADVKGTTFLSLEQKEGDDLQYLFLPALRRTRRIAGSAKNGRFMGTDFTYADLEFRDLREGDLKRLEDRVTSKRPCHVIEVKPKGEDDPYSKLIVHVDTKLSLPLKIEFFDRRGSAIKTLDTLALKKREDGSTYASKVRMKNLQRRSQTVIVVESLKDRGAISDDVFNPDLLAR